MDRLRMRGVLVRMSTVLMLVYGSTLPAVAGTDDVDALLDGVAEITDPAAPGEGGAQALCVYGDGASPVVVGDGAEDVKAPVVALSRWGVGRVVVFGDDDYFQAEVLDSADNGILMSNALRWAAVDQPTIIGVSYQGENYWVSKKMRGLRDWLASAGYQVVEVELTPKSLESVDIVAAIMFEDKSTQELEALASFVRVGRGLVVAGEGWIRKHAHPDMDLVEDYAGNRLLAPLGIQWSGEKLSRDSSESIAVDGPPSELTHGGVALAAVEAHEAGGRTLTQPEIDQAVDTLMHAARCLPLDDALLAPRLHALVEENDRWPSAEQPVSKTDIVTHIVATFFVVEHNRTPPEFVRAHPAAADFPGPVPTDAPHLTRSLTIDTTVPRWHSTGLYAAPGELARVTVPDEAAAVGGFHLRVGSHSDHLWSRSEWRRMPEISRRFPIFGTTTLVANAFGGLIYVCDFDDPDFEQWKRHPFLALIMYEQMQEAFGWEAYRRVFAEYRGLPDAERPKSDDEKRDQWLVRFSRQVGCNLGPFFEAWGVPTSRAARDSIADLPAWLPQARRRSRSVDPGRRPWETGLTG